QDDMMTEDIYILDCHSSVFIWVGQHVDTNIRAHALSIGEKFLELDILMENLSQETPLYVITEGSEPQFFTRFFFTWDSAKSAMHGNSFERRLSIVKNGGKPIRDKPKRRPTSSSHTGRCIVPDKPQRRTTSSSPDHARVRGRSPSFTVLAANFENPNARNLSTPPVATKPSPRTTPRTSPEPGKPHQRADSIAAISALFEQPRPNLIPKSRKGIVAFSERNTFYYLANIVLLSAMNLSLSKAGRAVNKHQPEASKTEPEANANETTPAAEDGQTVTPAKQEDAKEGQPEDVEGLPVYPYDRLRTSSTDPATAIDQARREMYLSSAEFREKFGMTKEAFAKLPKWKQTRLKITLQLF
uniref:HP domain-containing protein n=1 Tax=Aegilops tauschii subsp. strangulata TaxID=200361 RepID=A0A453T2J1_AEGTS